MVKTCAKIYPFDYVGIGGSFDHLHAGHHQLIKTAFKMGKKVGIALTTIELQKEKELPELIESYAVREKNLKTFLKKLDDINDERFEIIPLNDPFGPAITDTSLEAHVSSLETYQVAMKINEIRLLNGLNPLILIIIPYVLNDKGERISSSSIRKRLL